MPIITHQYVNCLMIEEILPWSKPDLLQEEEQVREPASRCDVVQHVADAV